MSKPGIIYRMTVQSFHETEDIQCIVDIGDMDNLIDDGDTEEIRELEPSGSPINLSIIDNNEDPLTVIKAQQLTLRFNSTYDYTAEDFVGGSDRRWYVHYYIASTSKTIFKGHVVKDGISETFNPVPNVVTLTATDNLALLKDVPLTDDNDSNMVGMYPIMEIVANCMKKTGLSLGFLVAFNIKNDGLEDDISIANSNDEHFLSNNYIDSKTFEKKIGESEDPYTVIQKLFKEMATITQYQGYWLIKRIDETEDATRGLYITEFDSDGVFVGNLGEKSFNKSIGIDEDIEFLLGTEVFFDLSHKFVQHNFSFATPQEIPENVDFVRGDLVTTVSPTQKRYLCDNWRMIQNLSTPAPPAGDAFIERYFEANGKETQRHLLLTSPVSPTANNLAVSQQIEVTEKSKFNFKADFATVSDMSGSGTYTQRVATIRLVADDGTYWMMDIDGSWAQSNSSWSTNFKDLEYQFVPNDKDTTEWTTLEVDSNQIPRTGKLFIDLYALNQQGGSFDDVDIKFANLQFNYIPIINGTHTSYSGTESKASQDGNYNRKREESVYIDNTTEKLFKGALNVIDSWASVYSGSVSFSNPKFFTISGFYILNYYPGMILRISGTTSNNMTTRVTEVSYGPGTGLTIVRIEDDTVVETDGSTTIETPVFALAGYFYDASKYPTGPGGNADLLNSFGWFRLFDAWNQVKNLKRIFQAVCQGTDLEKLDADSRVDLVHIIHKYLFTDDSHSGHTQDKLFQLLSMRQNHRTGEWHGTLREVCDLLEAKDYSNYQFTYKMNNL